MNRADLTNLSDRQLADLDDVCGAMLRLELRVTDAMMGGAVGQALTSELAELADELCMRRTRSQAALAEERHRRRAERLAEVTRPEHREHRIVHREDGGVKCDCGEYFWGENAVARAIDHKESAVNRG